MSPSPPSDDPFADDQPVAEGCAGPEAWGGADAEPPAGDLAELLWADEGAPADEAASAAISPPATDPAALLEEAREQVQRVWGHPELRPLQEEAMAATLAGRDVLVVLPTGGGKSLCYQAPALVRGGLTLVVSPLISLMKDQVDGLTQSGVRAGMLASGQDDEERALVRDALQRRELDLLYCSPERLASGGFVEWLARLGLAAIAVDEAHCISHWGHDFRPEYRGLADLRRRAGGVPLMALTATAPPRVREDIAEQLGLRDAAMLVGDFDRPNLTYRALPRGRLLDQVLGVIERHGGEAGIVYALRRRDTEDLARDLAARGVRAQPYHAGLPSEERARVQEDFLAERIDVVVATVAFGMGIDRPDVRFVVHASLPKGVEQYSQETGRAGRDGLPAECVLFYGGSDHHTWKRLMERSAEEAAQEGVEGALEDLGGALERLQAMWGLAAGAECRHKALVEHFGGTYELPAEGCGGCDVCLGELDALPDATVVAQKVLSCIVRCEQRYGAAHVTDVLRGANTQRIRQTGHDQLSTYGLLRDMPAALVRAVIDQLLSQGLAGVASGDYPTLFLTQAGAAVLRGESEVSLVQPRRPQRAQKRKALAEAAGGDVDQELFERLRTLRRQLAREREVPPYLIASDKTLAHLAAHRPTDQAGLLATPGIGEKKAAELGPALLEVLRG